MRPSAATGAAAERRQVTIKLADLRNPTAPTCSVGIEELHDLAGRFTGLVDRIAEG